MKRFGGLGPIYLPKPGVIVAGVLGLGFLAFFFLVPPWVGPWNVRQAAYGPAEGSMGIYYDTSAEPAPIQPEQDPVPAMPEGVPMAGEIYTNVQVLTDVSPLEFTRTMEAITEWVAPEQGCGFCHGGGDSPNYAAEYPRKNIARSMLAMTRTLNANWTNHVGAQGVTCFSCHQGQNQPDGQWHLDQPAVFAEAYDAPIPRPIPDPVRGGIIGAPQPWDTEAKSIREFFPNRPQRMFLLEGRPARNIQENEALVDGENPVGHNLDYGEQLYILMMQMSQGLGVNCTFCHQSRAIRDWSQSPPTRLRGYSGIRMTTALNQHIFSQLGPWTQQVQLGALGDPAKISCRTCHNGRQQPPGGMLTTYYPALVGPRSGDGPFNPVAALNPGIYELARAPIVGRPDTVLRAPFRPIWEPE